MKPIEFAQALKMVVDKGLDANTAFDNLLKLLKKKGAISILPKILKEFKKILEIQAIQKPTLSVSTEDAFKQTLSKLNLKESEVNKKIDETLIGGYKFEENGILTDHSYKKALLDLYRNITK